MIWTSFFFSYFFWFYVISYCPLDKMRISLFSKQGVFGNWRAVVCNLWTSCRKPWKSLLSFFYKFTCMRFHMGESKSAVFPILGKLVGNVGFQWGFPYDYLRTWGLDVVSLMFTWETMASLYFPLETWSIHVIYPWFTWDKPQVSTSFHGRESRRLDRTTFPFLRNHMESSSFPCGNHGKI